MEGVFPPVEILDALVECGLSNSLLVLNVAQWLDPPAALPLALPTAVHCPALTAQARSAAHCHPRWAKDICLAVLYTSSYASVATWAKF